MPDAFGLDEKIFQVAGTRIVNIGVADEIRDQDRREPDVCNDPERDRRCATQACEAR